MAKGTASVAPEPGCHAMRKRCGPPCAMRSTTRMVLTLTGSSSEMSQIRTVPSHDDDAKYCPSGSKATQRTASVWPLSGT